MAWYVYVVHFIGGVVLANGVPHFVNGISGRRFQSPFARPPGVGESSPLVNVLWGFANLVVGIILVRLWHGIAPRPPGDIAAILVGVLVAAVMLASHFGRVRGNV
jgi:hypothetical protein